MGTNPTHSQGKIIPAELIETIISSNLKDLAFQADPCNMNIYCIWMDIYKVTAMNNGACKSKFNQDI